MISRIVRYLIGFVYKPKWLKNVLALRKGAKRFLNYKRDFLEDDQIQEINGGLKKLDQAIAAHDRVASEKAADELESICQAAMPSYKAPAGLAENVEVIVVTIIVALGLRAYNVQIFRIPTGSMQPTLNGITATAMPEEEWPNFATRQIQRVTKGRNYIHEVADTDLRLPNNMRTFMREYQRFMFFTMTELTFADGKKVQVNASSTAVTDLLVASGVFERRNARSAPSPVMSKIPAGMAFLSGYSDSGDVIAVNKMSYHFAKPDRGEVIVFDTRGIEGIRKSSAPNPPGYNYIKRLAGVPGDTLSIGGPKGTDGYVYVNGQRSDAPGFSRVAQPEGPYKDLNPGGYILGEVPPKLTSIPLDNAGDKLVLSDDETDPLMTEYAVFGDNSGSSLDSRHWGSFKEYNITGKAWLSIWPFANGHFGLVD